MSNSSRVMSYLMSWLIGALVFTLGMKLLASVFNSSIFTDSVADSITIAAASTWAMMGIAAALAVLFAHGSIIDQGFLNWMLAGVPGILFFFLFTIISDAFAGGIANAGMAIVYSLPSVGLTFLVTLVGSIAGGFIRRGVTMPSRRPPSQ